MVPEEAVIYYHCYPEADTELPCWQCHHGSPSRMCTMGWYWSIIRRCAGCAGQSALRIFLVTTPDEYFRCKGIACINYCKEMSLGENDSEIQFNFIVMRCKQEGSMCV